MASGISFVKRVARRALPGPVIRWLGGRRPADGFDPVGFARTSGRSRRLEPLSREWGYDRGGPIDRHYVEAYLRSRASDIRGRVLEIGDDSYTRQFGGDRVEAVDILNVDEGDPRTTIVADLAHAEHIPSGRFDCIIFTQTLHLIYEAGAAVETLRRILKPGGVLLATFPGITRISWRELPGSWYWGFTSNSARRLFGDAFTPPAVEVESFGNVLAASAFLYGLGQDELSRAEFEHRDPEYEVVVAVRAVKPPEAA